MRRRPAFTRRASSATPNVTALKEEDAYPAEAGGRLRLGKTLQRADVPPLHGGFPTADAGWRVFHNVYGPEGTYEGGREKAPAAICRKVIEAKLSGKHEIEIWGDGHQTRSFMYIDDCVLGIQKIMQSANVIMPINLGSSEMVTINQLVDLAENIGGLKLKRNYNLKAPKGVNGRNSDNILIKKLLGWEPSIPLKAGLEKTYRWIYDDIQARKK